jgi:DNA-binding transcriptional LysR family regulator
MFIIPTMREVNISSVDLNLLAPLDALLRRRNVTRAAADVGLSQPAMSRALARLRALTNDPLLVRAPGGYALTPTAERLAAQLVPALEGVRALFRETVFDPTSIKRAVRIAAVDAQTILFAPLLSARLAATAPGIDLRFEAPTAATATRIELGEVDLAFALATTPLPPVALSEPILDDRLALVMRRGHPWAERAWTVEDYGAVGHAAISILGDSVSELDAELARHGVARRIALVTPSFAAALAAVAATDLVTTVSRAFAMRFAGAFDLMVREPPLAGVDLPVSIVWSSVRASDPLVTWLRALMRDVAIDLSGAMRTPVRTGSGAG